MAAGPCAIAGSMLGGYTTWDAGRRGGEAALRRHVPARILGRIIRWVERHGSSPSFFLQCFHLHSALAICCRRRRAGVSRQRFLAVYGAARSLRYSFIAWLAWSTDEGSYSCGLEFCRPGRPHCFACSWAPGHRYLLWDMEDARPQEDTWRKETHAQWSRRAFELKCSSCHRLRSPLYNEHRYPAANMATVVIATTIHPRRELG